MWQVLVLLGVVLAIVCYRDWRLGLFVVITAGIVQDPLRKLVPGEPVMLVTVVLAYLGMVAMGFLARHGLPSPQRLLAAYPSLARPFVFFVVVVAAHVLLTLLRYQTPALAGIGTVAYLAAPLALLLGINFQLYDRRGALLFSVYCGLVSAFALSIYASYLGVESPLFDQVGVGIKAYTEYGVLALHSGLFRSPDIAAWHAAAAAALLFAFAVGASSPWRRLLLLVAVVMLIVAGMLTGRRKMLGLMVLYASIFGFLVLHFRMRARGALTSLVLFGGVALTLAVEVASSVGLVAGIDPYVERFATVFGDAYRRLVDVGWNSVVSAWGQSGVLGQGAGVVSQGSQHFDVHRDFSSGSAEGGLGKVVIELGLIGLAVVTWLLVAVIGAFWGALRRVSDAPAHYSALVYGCAAFLIANLPVFFVAAQVFGDPFVLVMLGIMASNVLVVSMMVPAARSMRPVLRRVAPPRPPLGRAIP